MLTYKIHSVVQSAPAQFGKTRVVFKTNETGEKMISCFTKFPDSIGVGKEIQGEIKEVQKDGKTYYNFEFGKADSGPSAGGVSDSGKVFFELTKITLLLREIHAAVVKPKTPYPESQGEPEF